MRNKIVTSVVMIPFMVACATTGVEEVEHRPFNSKNITTEMVVDKIEVGSKNEAASCYLAVRDGRNYTSGVGGHKYRGSETRINFLRDQMNFAKGVWRAIYERESGGAQFSEVALQAEAKAFGGYMLDMLLLKNMSRREEKRINKCVEPVQSALEGLSGERSKE